MSITRFHLAFLASLALLGSALASAQGAKTTNDGVYTADQAARGERVFKGKCGSCHYPTQFIGDDLFKAWADKPLAELFNVVRESMPEDNPGTLPPQEYGDVITYFLQLNKFPTGSEELVASEDAMRAIMLARPK